MLIQQIFAIITEINEQGTTVLLVEQNAQQALPRAHRAYVLETGRIVKVRAAGRSCSPTRPSRTPTSASPERRRPVPERWPAATAATAVRLS